ncbi:MAG: bacillithiol biosynthesis cysteine-adding enzyme BshC [Acidobacteriota bacterium]|nr:bacillithiol biosynthesis cysteine-adding enzyme BshC [Acidobacteriota bacterium]
MESGCLRYSDIPHTSKLFLDFQYHFDRVSQFYAHCPMDPGCYDAAAAQVDFPAERRSALVAALRATNGDHPAEINSLDRLAQDGTVAVVTGQQVGLFSGPAYTIYKALTAARLADELTQRGIPAVPVFWLATEDHDLAEINHTFVFDQSHHAVTLRVDGLGAPQQPVGSIPVGTPPIDELRTALAGLPFGSEVSDLVAAAYQPGVSFGVAFRELLRSLLTGRGILFVDPLDAGLRNIMAPLLATAVTRAGELKERLLTRNRELEAAGYHAQVHIEPQTSLFFLLDGNRRITLRKEDGEYVSKERRYSAAELAEHAAQLSPNALLRPVMQDYLLPTVAYVGGPAELAYLAQSQVLYQELLGRMPVVVARSGFTLLDHHAAKTMQRFQLSLPTVFQGETHTRESIARRLVPAALIGELETMEHATAQSLDRLRKQFTDFDPTLARALDNSRTKILYQLSKMGRKVARETLRRDTRAAEDARLLSNLVYPEKHLQERYYSILPFLAKHGDGLLDTLYDNIHLDCPDHKYLVV